MPAALDIHLVVDNYATHRHAKVRAWLARRPRYHLHFTPTYASWLNQVERWFGLISQRAIKRASFRNVTHLVRTIKEFTERYNEEEAKPFVWAATSQSIIDKCGAPSYAYLRDTTIAVQLPFPGDQRPVARLLHEMAEGPLPFRQDSEALPVAVLVAARHQLHAGVRAERLGIGVVEMNPLTGQAVQHRRRVGAPSVGSQGFVAQIVRQDQDDVGAVPPGSGLHRAGNDRRGGHDDEEGQEPGRHAGELADPRRSCQVKQRTGSGDESFPPSLVIACPVSYSLDFVRMLRVSRVPLRSLGWEVDARSYRNRRG